MTALFQRQIRQQRDRFAPRDPKLFAIVREFESLTGFPCLAITPLRVPDEPLVSSPLDALRTFQRLGAEYAAFGSFLVRSPDRPEPRQG